MLLFLSACGNGVSSIPPTPTRHNKSSEPKLAARQVLTFPNAGIADSAPLDPAIVVGRQYQPNLEHGLQWIGTR